MSRNKGFAPLPPKSRRQNDKSEDEEKSLVLLFDELSRNSLVLCNGAEEEFLQFAANQEFCRRRWLTAEAEVQRLSIELQSSETEVRIMHFSSIHLCFVHRI